ncbi:MAG: PQQ-like beta-propeller repeat protein [Verrucomicrobia bacterium]|nr:PQQ-like beta-propeller repeat protein [Verrucomicrobiota bacterium]
MGRWVLLLVGCWAGIGWARAQDGTLEWSVILQGFASSSPALSPDGRTVYIGVETSTAGRIVAINADGSPKWSVVRPEAVYSSPAVGPDGTVYVGVDDGKLYALNPANGAIKWEYDTRTFVSSSPAIGADGTLYFGAGDAKLHAVSPTGVERWSFQTGDWVESSPAVGTDGTIYFGSADKNVYAVRSDGTEKWRFATGGKVYSSPAIGVDGTIYVGSADQRMYAITPDGVKKWDFLANGEIAASPVLGADGTVYFAALDASFYALSGETGERLWRTSLSTNSYSTAAVRGDGTVLFGADDGFVRALDPRDGAVKWRYDTKAGVGDYIESSPLVAPDGSIYFGSLDGRLYKLRGNASPLSAVSSWPAFRRDVAHTGRSVYVSNGGRLLNLASRARVAGGDTLIAGFVVEGGAARAFMVRGIGPALAQFGVAGFMPDPRLDLFAGQTLTYSNDNWSDAEPGSSLVDTADAVGAFPLPPGSRDAALVMPLRSGLYSAHLRAADDRGGVALFEVYDAVGGDPASHLVNLSLRGRVGTGEDVLIAGVVVGGVHPTRLLVRAVGPGLAGFGVQGILARPTIEFYRGATLLRSNTGWSSEGLTQDLASAAASVAAFPLVPGSQDSAMVLMVDPGPYTLQVTGVGGSMGEALAEIYVLR